MNLDNVVEFKKSTNVLFELFLEDYKNKNFESALKRINSIQNENPSDEFSKWKGFLFFQTKTRSLEALDQYAKMLCGHDAYAQRIGGLGILDFFAGQKNTNLVLFYVDFMNKNLSSNLPSEIADSINGEMKKIQKAIISSSFSLVEKPIKKSSLSEAEFLILENNFLTAVNLLSKIEEDDESFVDAQGLLANCFFELKDFENSEKYAVKVLEIKNQDLDALIILAKSQFESKSKKLHETVEEIKKIEFEKIVDVLNVANLFLFIHDFDSLVQIVQPELLKNPFTSELFFALGLALFNLGEVNGAKESFWKAFAFSEKQILAKEFYLQIERDLKKLPKQIFVEKEIPKIIQKNVLTKINLILSSAPEKIEKMNFGSLKSALLWTEQFFDEKATIELLRLFLQTKKGIKIVKDILLSFSASEKLKRIAVFSLAMNGINITNVMLIVDEKIKKIDVLLPKRLFSESNVDEKGNWWKDSPVDLGLFSICFAEVFSFLAFSKTDFEKKLKNVSERFVESLSTFPFNLKKFLTKKNITCALVFSTLAEEIVDGKIEFSNDSNNLLAYLVGVFDASMPEVKKILTETF